MRAAFRFGFGVGVWGFGVGVRVEIERLFSVALDLSRYGLGVGDRFGGSLSMEHGRALESRPSSQFGSVRRRHGRDPT
jgi:hypothetical protein